MTHLPAPIAAYVEAANSHDAARVADCFQPDAVVRDEGQTHEGRAAITGWARDTSERYRLSMTPLALEPKGEHQQLRARVAGNFPGSPAELHFDFALRGGRIQSLEIG
ncbi:hypothetical protein B0920_18855 [Massilia sp. KIM]|uniref:nuclear transport factor 2 family protein n=1 Tax=Massilia sp. KIM TaxID=1955422 RepID=UPI00098FECEE|nr:nuclear transport factor 2 family protein [Massilia sp. KIM]OON60996.1 hypothetical protein B0920_18855 [Massilia sp. KIM]